MNFFDEIFVVVFDNFLYLFTIANFRIGVPSILFGLKCYETNCLKNVTIGQSKTICRTTLVILAESKL